MDESHPKQLRQRLYGRQRGHRLRPHQAELIEMLLPRLSVPEGDAAIEPCSLFGDKTSFCLEIGFGAGEHLLWQAQTHPQTGFIGCEPFLNGVASLLSGVEREGVQNIRILMGDARELLARLSPACLDKVFLLFPDPWPKKRHRKRRFVSPDSLDALARCLKPGGEFHFATDIDDYCRWTLHHISAHPAFEWEVERAEDWRLPPEGWPGTRYEAKALKAGRNCVFLRFLRTSAEI